MEEDNRNTSDKKKLLWPAALHSIFLEAIIIIIGAGKDVVAKGILEVMMTNVEISHILRAMNAQELTRTHVASHWQKLKKFLTTKSRRKNKFGRWHSQSHYFRHQHMLIQHQLAANAAAATGRHLGAPLWSHQLQAVLVAADDEKKLKNNVTATAENPVIICPSPYSPQEAILQAFGDDTVNNSGTSQNWFSEFGAGEYEDCLSGCLKDASKTAQGIYDDELTRGLEDIRGFQDLDLCSIMGFFDKP